MSRTLDKKTIIPLKVSLEIASKFLALLANKPCAIGALVLQPDAIGTILPVVVHSIRQYITTGWPPELPACAQ